MSEEPNAAAAEGTDPFAASLALSGASREKADAYINDQRQPRTAQADPPQYLREMAGRVSQVGDLVRRHRRATGVGLLAWDAVHGNGLLIEPFSVPPDMAAKGLIGQVVASQVLDRLTTIQTTTVSDPEL